MSVSQGVLVRLNKLHGNISEYFVVYILRFGNNSCDVVNGGIILNGVFYHLKCHNFISPFITFINNFATGNIRYKRLCNPLSHIFPCETFKLTDNCEHKNPNSGTRSKPTGSIIIPFSFNFTAHFFFNQTLNLLKERTYAFFSWSHFRFATKKVFILSLYSEHLLCFVVWGKWR